MLKNVHRKPDKRQAKPWKRTNEYEKRIKKHQKPLLKPPSPGPIIDNPPPMPSDACGSRCNLPPLPDFTPVSLGFGVLLRLSCTGERAPRAADRVIEATQLSRLHHPHQDRPDGGVGEIAPSFCPQR